MSEIMVGVGLLESLVDGDDCSFDHHGGCQTHGYLSLRPGELCPQQELKDLLASVGRKSPGEAAYLGYFVACGGKSLISGVVLPLWDDQSPGVRAAWEAAAAAVTVAVS